MLEIREIEVESSYGAPDHVVYRSTLNQFPSIEVRYHRTLESGVIEAIAEDTMSAAADDQRETFEPQLTASITLSIRDGKGEPLEFSGMPVKPGHHISVGGIGSSFTLMHQAAVISAYDPSIYEIREPADGEGRLRFTEESVTARAAEILAETIKHWTAASGSDQARIRGSESNETLKDQLHAQNEKVYDKVDRLLRFSETDFPGVAGLDGYSNVNKAINYDIWATLFSPREDFLSVLHALMSRWNFYYAPPKTPDEVGVIRRMDWILEADETKEATCISIDTQAGSSSFLPITQVLVEGLGEGPARDDVNPEDDADPNLVPRTYAAYPETFRGGKVLRSPLPSFLSLPFRDTTGSEGENLNIDTYRQAKADAKSNLNSFTDTHITEFARTWAKQLYVDAALASSTVMLVMDLDLSWYVGTVYEVKALYQDSSGGGAAGHVLFTGLLSNEESIVKTGDSGLQVATNLQFTHVRVMENTLPV